ncbi:hypothetical protein JOC86_004938 [Bacillus pakistanensis]|uniref:Uncharacterized protein n=1 Tax=Rossellomorea pakistanensis TaxID=992288 RepID=A0ABS2NKI6_9BACI|nr:hypothetical protein [Bacillus pakistanensis]
MSQKLNQLALEAEMVVVMDLPLLIKSMYLPR